jgi:hypothetical protein
LKQNVIVISDNAEPEFERVIGKGLDEFNEQIAGLSDRRSLCVIVRDSVSNEVLGGLLAELLLGLLFWTCFTCRALCVVQD